MTTKFKKPIALLLAVAIAMLLNFPSGLFAGIGIGLTANAEDNTCNHEWGTEKTATIDPTCTEGGYDVYACEKCGTEKKVPNDTPATGHNKGGDGKCTNCGAYMISNADELKTFAATVNGGETSANAVLTANITVNEDVLKADGTLADDVSGFTSWTPIGYVDNIYTGTFNGQGHTISGLYFNDTNIDYVGLFGNVGTGGSVLNVGVVDSYFSGKNFVGGVCGSDLESTIENCYNTGSVSGGDYVGGVCGFNYSGRVTNSYNTGSVSGSGDFVGGVCGQNYGGTITNCYYLSKTSGSDRKTAAQFKSGEVAYLLSQGGGNGGSVWGQKIGTDDYPVLNGDTVYATTGCATYNNSGDTSEKEHKYEKGICTDCGGYKEPEKDESGVYQISKVTDLYWLADTVNSGNNSANAVLTANITVNEGVLKDDGTLADDVSGFTSWTPIGYYNSDSDNNPYTGTFNGQGHTISGLYFNDTNTDSVGLFGYVGTVTDKNDNVISAGKVSNVGVVDSYFSGRNGVGGVCGDNEGTITSCYNEGTVSGSNLVGGVCGGNNSKGKITNCYNTGTVSGSGYCVGGVCGYNFESTIENCYNTGSVSGSNGVGGVCGGNSGEITNCYYLSKISGSDRKTAAQFKSGEVAYLLSQGGGNGGSVWGQKIGTDDYPVLNGDTVYATTGCATYNNEGDTREKEHHYEEGICTDCGAYTEPEKDKNGVYQISKAADLYWFAEYVNSGNNSVNAVLTNDITVNEGVLKADGTLADDVSGFTSWTPIGYYNNDSDNNPYTGTFDGQGHTISGLYFNDANTDYVGLFGYVGTVTDENDNVISAGKVSNVGVVDSYFSGRNGVGGVCGINEGTITSCYNEGTVSGSGKYVGGVCGDNENGTIENCYNTGSVSGGADVGGVCGNNSGKITNCYNEGTVSGSSESYSVGGVCGRNYGTIEKCYNTGSVSGRNGVGGVCAYNDHGTIENCYNTGSVSGGKGVGGVCGYNDGDTITNCYSTGAVDGDRLVGGVCGKNDEGTITNCYNEGTVSGSSYNVGGVCGATYLGKIENCYNEGTVSGGEDVGGVCGKNDVGTITNCYSTGAVDGDRLVGGVCGNNNSTITNCYYLKTGTINNDINAIGNEESDTEGKAESITTTDSICELVNYHSHQNGICIWCRGYEPATKTTDKYDIDNDGKKDIVYEISSAGQLYWFAGLVNGDESVCDYDSVSKPDGTQQNLSANAVLTADITVNKYVLKADGTLADDVSGFTAWTPIGYENNRYSGTFDGAGHTISGLYFNNTATNYVGLFGYVGENASGTVLNVGVVDSYFSGNEYVGGVCGKNYGTITNCYNTAVVSGGSYYVGGVCGYNEYGTITNCYNTGTVSGSSNHVGGVCGYSHGTIENCYNTGSVSGSSSNYYVGGVCGFNEGTIKNCYNTGTVSGGRYYVGGVCGYNYGGTIKNCYYLAGTASNGIGVDSTSSGIAVSINITKFTGGEVAYILQSVQTPATEGGTIPQVWGQKLTGETKDTSPVLTSNSAKKVYKVTFATQSNSFYAVKYANPSGVYELPTAPSIDNSNNGFYKWSTSKTDYSNAANDFTKNTAVAGDMTVYAVSGEKYGENDNEKTVTTTYGTGTTQDLSAYTVFASYTPAEGETPASGTASAGKFTYTIESGNDTKLGAAINGDTLTIPSTAAAGTYTLTIKATVKTDNVDVSLMSVDFGTVPITFDVTVTIEPITEDTPNITVNYTDETLTGFDTNGSYAIDGTDVTPTNGVLAVESYIGSEISIVKKASDTNHAGSTAQTLTIKQRPTAPTESDFTVTQPELVDGTGSIEGITSAMEYSTDNGTTWTTGDNSTIEDIEGGTTYLVRYKATSDSFKSDSYVVLINEGTVEEITPIGKYYDSVKIEKQVVGDKAVFTITPVGGNADEIPSVTLYLAEYNDNGQLSSVKKGVKNTDGKLEITLPTTNNYKLMLWDNDQCPLINAITNIY